MSHRMRTIRAVLCGTYKRDLDALRKTYDELVTNGCQVLSPHSLNFVSNEKGFQRTTHERRRSAEELERHHIFAIGEANFIWLHAPGGYIGASAAMEIGYAFAQEVPVFSREEIDDPALAPFVQTASSVFEVLYDLDTE